MDKSGISRFDERQSGLCCFFNTENCNKSAA